MEAVEESEARACNLGKKGRPQPIARTKDGLQKEYPVKVAFNTVRFLFEVTLSKVTEDDWNVGAAGGSRDVDLGVKIDLRRLENTSFISDSSARSEFPAFRNCNSACRRRTWERKRAQSHPRVSHAMEEEDLKGRPKDARLKGGPQVDTYSEDW